jgi:hypothetical protein
LRRFEKEEVCAKLRKCGEEILDRMESNLFEHKQQRLTVEEDKDMSLRRAFE